MGDVTRCQFLNQKNYSINGKLQGVRCKKEATAHQTCPHGRSYHFCTVHSYTMERFVGAS